MKALCNDLWDLLLGSAQIDPDDLAEAVETQAHRTDLDFRTRLLIRDSIDALDRIWGRKRTDQWLGISPAGETLRHIWQSDLGEQGFPSLDQRLMPMTRRKTVLQFLRDLGLRMAEPQRITIGGAIALVLEAGLARHTEDIDVVDEVPAELRNHPELPDSLAARYGLRLTHFQSHYLPSGWADRVHSLGPFGQLQVFVVDVYDVLLGKLFSSREKDLDDLRILLPRLDKSKFVERLVNTGGALLADSHLRPSAERNWYVLYGEPLPLPMK